MRPGTKTPALATAISVVNNSEKQRVKGQSNGYCGKAFRDVLTTFTWHTAEEVSEEVLNLLKLNHQEYAQYQHFRYVEAFHLMQELI